ncbi:hypothetical protein ET475_06580 [Microbacterium protaetiae]|uniref:Uncharacterized protein n=1 Tax=Microbacterium protaetiae TaxID=2509458 RepID=A0A4V0YD71_9MICO|nr:hypothetical protein [Microbacterium protaetiae]QAY59691.1 hypothetical protein ET475_06580 [Microbacterium protaetiae]
MNTTVTPVDRIAAFAAAVRAELSDLPADEVDDIVEGLESDLAEQAAERGEDFQVPDAAAYAAELRQAAGLPDRPAGVSARQAFSAHLRQFGHRVVRGIRSSRAGAWLLDMAVALRPVWWLMRGWMLAVLVVVILQITILPGVAGWLPVPIMGGGWVVLLAAMLVSVQWGRGRWLPWRWMRVAVPVLSVVSVVMLPFLAGITIGQIHSWRNQAQSAYQPYAATQPGLAVDGQSVRNIFAYDSDGNPLTDVQLFDQDGNPLTTVGERSAGGTVDDYYAWGGGPVPVAVSVPGRNPVWNVFPLSEIPAGQDDSSPTLAVAPVPPFAQVPSLQRLLATSPTPGVSETPSVPDPVPSPDDKSPSPTKTGGTDPSPTATDGAAVGDAVAGDAAGAAGDADGAGAGGDAAGAAGGDAAGAGPDATTTVAAEGTGR